MKVWLDATAPMPAGFDYHARSVPEAITLFLDGKVEHLSIGPGFGLYHMGESGSFLAEWIELGARLGTIHKVGWDVHYRGVEAEMIEATLARADEWWASV